MKRGRCHVIQDNGRDLFNYSSIDRTRTMRPLSESTSAEPLGRTDFLFIFAGMALATALGMFLLGRHSIWVDEAESIYRCLGLHRMLRSMIFEGNMWFYYTLLHGWLVLGESEVAVRSLSVLFAVLTVPAVYGLGRLLFGSATARIAVLILPVNAFFIHYAQEARSYSLLILLSALSSYFFIACLRHPTGRFRLGYIAVGAASVYAHLFAVLTLFSQAASLVLAKTAWKRWRWWLLAWGAIALLIAPLPILHIRAGRAAAIGWIPRPDLAALADLALQLAGNRSVLLAAYFCLCLFALGYMGWNFKKKREVHLWPSAFILIWLLCPPIGTFVFSLLIKPVLIDRYLSACVIPLVLLVSFGLAGLPQGRVRIGAVAVLMVLSTSGLAAWYFEPQKEDWRGTVSSILEQARPGDAVVLYPYWTRRAFGYYLKRLDGTHNQLTILNSSPFDRDKSPSARPMNAFLSNLPKQYSRVWLIISHTDLPRLGRDRKARISKAAMAAGYPRLKIEQFFQIEVRLYAK